MRVAIAEVKPSKPLANTMSTIVPVGIVLAGATKATTGDNLGTGEAGTEFEMIDSVTGERLAAAVDRRQGGKVCSVANGKTRKMPLITGRRRFANDLTRCVKTRSF